MNQEENGIRIIEGAAELFRVYGIRDVTMDMIAGHLGVSKRTIYEKFGDKDELLFAVMQMMIRKQREKIDTILESSPNVIVAVFTLVKIGRDHAANMNPLIGSDLRKYHSKVMQRIRDKCENPDYEGGKKLLGRGIEQGLIRSDINKEIVARAFSGLGPFISDERTFPAEQFSKRDLIKDVLINYLRGVATRKGEELIKELEIEL